MNKVLSSLWSLLMVAALVVNTSCGKEEDPLPSAPSITIPGVADAEGTTVSAGQMVTFVVKVSAPGGFAALQVDKTVGSGAPETFDAVASTAGELEYSYPFEYTPTSAEAGQVIKFDFEATDKNGQSNTHTFEITVNENPISTYQAVLLGGQSNTTNGSFYNAFDNAVYKYNDAISAQNKSKVDFVYYYATSGTTPANATLAAPANESARTAFQAAGASIPADMNNESYFVRTTKAFNEITSSTGIEAAYNQSVSSTNPAETRITNLEAGQTFAFMLDDARGMRYGVAQVVSVQGTTSGDRKITLNIKVQTVNNN